MDNAMVSEKEIEYARSQHIARIYTAALSVEGSPQPDVVPLGFHFDGEYFYVGGMNILKSEKYKNVLKNNKVALVSDDSKSVDPWDPRGIRIDGTADIVTRHSSSWIHGTDSSHRTGIYVNSGSSNNKLYDNTLTDSKSHAILINLLFE
jgi:pyridoxamine 5'-phosphate oxidase family protein